MDIRETKMKIYLDDIRVPTKDYIWVKDAFSAIRMIAENWNNIEEISLDHDLGDENVVGNGYRVVCFIETYVYENHPNHLPYIHVHSANPVGRHKMEAGIRHIETMYNDYM